MSDFSEKTVVITGGSSGIGAATVDLFVSRGAHVFVLDIVPPQASLPKHAQYVVCDVRSKEQIYAAAEFVAARSAAPAVLVANAGAHGTASLEDTSDELFERVVGVNLKGTFYTIKAFLPAMREARSGSVILMGSDQSLIGKAKGSIYGATKGAVAQLCKSTALEYAPFNIRVNCICPGAIKTGLYDRAIAEYSENYATVDPVVLEQQVKERHPLGRVGTPEEVAEFIVFLASDRASFITGAILSIDGGYTAQ